LREADSKKTEYKTSEKHRLHSKIYHGVRAEERKKGTSEEKAKDGTHARMWA
jgi:hypothetical protein